jgi:chaperonin GroES
MKLMRPYPYGSSISHDVSHDLNRKELDMHIRPLHDRIIVKRVEKARQTASGIFIPDTAAEKPEQGEVLAVGPGKRLQDGSLQTPQVKVGDQVLFGKYGGQTVKLDDQEYLVLREEDVFGVIEGTSSASLKAA